MLESSSSPFLARDDSISLLGMIQRRRWTYIWIIAASVALMTVYSFVATQKYTAEITLFQRNFDFLSENMIGQSLLALGSSQLQSPIDHFTVAMTSRPVAQLLINKQGIDKILFEDQWNTETNSWKPKPGIFAWIKRQINVVFGLPAWTPPDESDLAELLQDKIDVTLTDTDGTLQLSYENKDPKVAALVLQSLYDDTMTIIRQDQVNALEHVFDTVLNRLNNTHNVILKSSITDFASQSLVEMTRASARSVEVGVLNPVRVSATPTSPRPLLNMLIGVLLGLLIIGSWYLFDLTAWTVRARLEAA